MKNRAFSKIWIIGILAVVLAGGFLVWQRLGALKEKVQTGIIDGSLGYPGEGIPEEMKICAENIATKKQYCTEKHIQDNKYTHKFGYSIEVPVGDYYVFATLPSWKDYKSYYSEFVTCGSSVDCPSHEPITVVVKANSITTSIDPQDWYKPLNEIANWETYSGNGFEFKYPEGIAKEYIKTQIWPPKTIIGPVDPDFICEELQQIKTSLGYGSQKEVKTGNSKYCVLTVSEGAAGTLYTTYKYIADKDGKQLNLEFTLRFPNCGAMADDTTMKACEEEEKNFEPAELIDQILSTFRFLE